MHHIYRPAPWEEIWQAMETLVQQGKVLYVGSSNFAGWHIVPANEAGKARHFLRVRGGALKKIEEGRRASDDMKKEIEEKRPKLEAWEKFCKELGEQPADVALA